MEQRGDIVNNSNIDSNKKKRVIRIIILLVVIVLVIIGIIFVLQNKKTTSGQEGQKNIISQKTDQTCVSGLKGAWEFPTETGECEQYGDSARRKLTSSDNPSKEGQICCK